MACEATIKYTFSPQDVAERKAKERKINLLLLIQQFLKSEGYIESYYQLSSESKLPKEYEICDNIELNHILQDYETYYFIRFQKYPKISKKTTIPNGISEKTVVKKKKTPITREPEKESLKDKLDLAAGISVVSFPLEHSQQYNQHDVSNEKLFKPLGSFEGYSDEWKSMADVISREIVEKNLNVKWNDIIGLDDAKQLLMEAIVYPIKYPQIYKGTITPWRGLLLYGPSGTGKTLLAKAVASECNTTFFNISASSIVSKWRGDSEKLVRVMFDLARLQAPSTIFIDELDAIASNRDSIHEHEASRRLKSELLVQLDGLCQNNDNIFVLTTTNLPWDLDVAILRRLERRIFVGLPGLNARQMLIKMYLPKDITSGTPFLTSCVDYGLLAKKCDGYSGSDIKLLCKEVIMSSLRKLFHQLDKAASVLSPLPPIINEDFEEALLIVKPSITKCIEKYKLWEINDLNIK